MRREPFTDASASSLRVMARRIFCGDGHQETSYSVFCPRRQGIIAVEDCAECSAFLGRLHLTAAEGGELLVCAGAPEVEGEEVLHRPRRKEHAGAGDKTPISQIMSRDVLCVRKDLSVEALTALFLERSISGAPVVDERGRPIGVVSKTDILREQFVAGETAVERTGGPVRVRREGGVVQNLGSGYHEEQLAGATVSDVMTPSVYALHARTSVAQASALMAFEGIHRIAVIDEGGVVVGLLSTLDVLRWLAEQEGYLLPPRHLAAV
ncbi:MAG: CBS domain-containing protein [Deltaproteobacteria bacterium]|nr:CBS domain-containing protein [Deltaproteobacteria bacterium]